MKEIIDIIQAYDRACAVGRSCALASVVRVEGSSYRRPGARMLVDDNGEITGAISGGCLEGDTKRKALLAIQQQKNRILTYDSRDEEGEIFGIQLGCNGVVHILLEPVNAQVPNNPIELLRSWVKSGSDACLVTLFGGADADEHPGTCLIKWRIYASAANEIEQMVEEILYSRKSLIKQITFDSKEYQALFHYIPAPITLVICGAGNDAQPLAQMAALLGWRVTVVDGRRTHANAQRFPQVKTHVIKPGDTLPPATAYILMSHNYNYDLSVLSTLIDSNALYIGLLGPRTRRERLLSELPSVARKLPVYGPAGIDIGAETAEEIAVSIIAEIKAVSSGARATFLRDKANAIHARALS